MRFPVHQGSAKEMLGMLYPGAGTQYDAETRPDLEIFQCAGPI